MLRRLDLGGSPYVGVFCAANDDVLIAPPSLPKAAVRHFTEALRTRIVQTHVAHSTVIGRLVAMNANGILTSPFIEPDEIEAIGDGVHPLPDRLSAVGNNVLCNDRGALVHPGYDPDALSFISDALGVRAVRGTIAGIRTVGSVAVATNKGVLCHPHAKPPELDLVKEVLGAPVAITTANYGQGFVGACMVANSYGAVVGARTTPIELGRIEEGLGYF
ncbi:MAG TPA: translation initiation factor IF-6 [Thermoplasmata archaeon]|nr:translation initiation factor IF-6 [Thermoplasmata archaeon]